MYLIDINCVVYFWPAVDFVCCLFNNVISSLVYIVLNDNELEKM
jgi:hypothetical protein